MEMEGTKRMEKILGGPYTVENLKDFIVPAGIYNDLATGMKQIMKKISRG